MNRAVDSGHVSTWTHTVSKTCGCFPQVPYWGYIRAILDLDEVLLGLYRDNRKEKLQLAQSQRGPAIPS